MLMRVVVEVLTGALFYVEVSDDAKVSDLKREIETQRKLPADRLILFLNSHGTHLIAEAEDGVLLVDMGVQDEDHFYLFFKPPDHMFDNNIHDGSGDGDGGGGWAESTTKPLPSSIPATPLGGDESEDK